MMSNFSGAVNSQDNDMAKDVLLSEIHRILDKNPEILIQTLNDSGIATSSKISKRELIHKVVEAIYESEKFRANISKFIIQGNDEQNENFVGAIITSINTVFQGVQNRNQNKAQKEADKRKLAALLLEDKNKKTNYLPIVIIGGVLLIGGIVAYISLKNK
jgi:Mor family transcriptional regulator